MVWRRLSRCFSGDPIIIFSSAISLSSTDCWSEGLDEGGGRGIRRGDNQRMIRHDILKDNAFSMSLKQ